MAFRLNAKQFFLTYPKCDVEKSEALDQIKSKFAAIVDRYVIAKEDHADGTPHLHMYIHFSQKVNVVRATKFDLSFGGKTFHGNYQTARSAKAVMQYCKKDGNFISDGVEMDEGSWARAIFLAREGEMGRAVELLIDEKPRDICMHGDQIRLNLGRLVKATPYAPPVLQAPPRLPLALSASLAALGKKSLILWGSPGTGKTWWARSIGPHRFVTHLEQLKAPTVLSGELLVFDDMAFAHLPRQTCIYLVDCEQERKIHVRYGTVSIPAGVKKIFLTNQDPSELFSAWDDALRRRVVEVEVTAKLY